MTRLDITDKLTHFTGPKDDPEGAYRRLISIIDQGVILGGVGMIRGGFRCVCFTEAPLDALPGGLVNQFDYSRYAPFGIMIDKAWLFARGGRPVIYQSDLEYDLLPPELRWRHVRYEPTVFPPIDFTWEREWRLYEDELRITPADAAVIVPNRDWGERLVDEFDEEQEYRVQMYANVLDHDIAEQYREEFPWRLIDLGL